jgi:flagellar biosynthesis anti-sigma factor FlgM
MRLGDFTMTRIERTAATAPAKELKSVAVPAERATAGATTVTLSSRAVASSAKVEALRAAIDGGTYRVDLGAVAAKLVGEEG